MDTIVDLRTEVLHRLVFELRYEFGHVYWDRAGRIAKNILAEREEWDFDSIDTNRCQLAHRDLNLVFHFGPTRLDLSQTQNADVASLMDVGEFAKTAEALVKMVIDQLELEVFPRIGFRAWHLYDAKTRDNSYELMANLALFPSSSEQLEFLGTVSERSHTLVAERSNHTLRIAVTPAEQQVELPESVLRAARVETHKLPRNQRQALIDRKKAEKAIANYPHFGSS